MKKILFILILAASSAYGVTNTVRNVVETRDANSPIISQSSITASNMFLYSTGTSPNSVAAYSQLTNAVVSTSTNAVTITSIPTITNGQMFTNTGKPALVFWSTFMAPNLSGTCETEFWTSYGGVTNVFGAGLYSNAALGVLNTSKVPGSAPVQPGAIFWWTNIQTSGTHYVTNGFYKVQ